MAVDSMVNGGCVISGGTVKSVLFSGVRVEAGAVVEAISLVLPDVQIGRGVRVRNAIIDRGCELPDGMVIGETTPRTENAFA